MSEWKEYKICDIGKVITGKTPPTNDTDNYGNDIPFICIPDLGISRYVRRINKSLSAKGLSKVKNCLLPKDSITVSCIATIGKVGITCKPSVTNQQINSIIPKQDLVNPKYIYYWFLNEGDSIGVYGGGGSVFNIISKSKFEQITITIPSLFTQAAIAEILSSLDDKIELNNEINKNLEALSQALFKHWFVDFEFPNENGEPYKSSGGEMVESDLGLIPKAWSVSTLGNFGNVICGKTPPKSNPNNFGGEIPFIKIPDMHGNVYVVKSQDSLSYDGAISQKNKELPPNSIIVSSIATVGLISIVTKRSHTNQQINAIVPINNYYSYFLYSLCKTLQPEFIRCASGGSATLNMNTSTFKSIRVIYPINHLILAFHEAVHEVYTKILYNLNENENLSALRDLLLPKLISGELEVKEAIKQTEKAL